MSLADLRVRMGRGPGIAAGPLGLVSRASMERMGGTRAPPPGNQRTPAGLQWRVVRATALTHPEPGKESAQNRTCWSLFHVESGLDAAPSGGLNGDDIIRIYLGRQQQPVQVDICPVVE